MKIIILLLALLSCPSIFAFKVKGTVIRIHDGDTLTITSLDLPATKSVRMIGIDTPEVDFNGFSQGEAAIAARDYLRSLLPIGSEIIVDMGRDGSLNDRRLLGTIFLGEIDINKEMLKSGHAAPYFIEPFDKSLMFEYVSSAKEAYRLEIGIFGSDTEIPYEFRMRVQNKTGSNYVADIESKILYYPDEASQVLPYNRLFIRSLERARALGYELRP